MEVPCFVKQEHNWQPNSNHKTFLEEQGFLYQDIVEGNLEHNSKEEHLSVVQSWAFFGTIMTICQVVLVPVNLGDFLRRDENGKLFITTAQLLNVLRAWIFHERRKLPSESRPQREARIKNTLTALSKFVSDVLELELQGGGYSSKEIVEGAGKTALSKSGRLLRSIKEQYVETGEYHEFEKIIDDEYYERNQNFFSGPLVGECYEWTDNDVKWKSRSMSPSHLLILSLAVLGETMEAARKICYENRDKISFRTPAFLSCLLEVTGWCTVDVKRVTELTGPSVTYYLTTIDRRSARESHKGCCPNTGCLAFQITANTYKGKHTTAECTCEYVSLQGDLDFIKGCIEEGTVPLIFLKSEEQAPELEIGLIGWGGERCSDEFPFVAISHIWADGIGNTEENAIPTCQLRRLQKAVNELYPAEDRLKPSVPFWIDTLMVPLEPEAKAKAIAGMEHVYRSANKVLVFDASLESIKSDGDPQELMMRIYLCPWMSRLWTLQEAFLAKDLYFQLADDSLIIETLTFDFRQKLLMEDLLTFQAVHDRVVADDQADEYTYDKAIHSLLKERLSTYVNEDGRITEQDDELDLHLVRTFAIHLLMFLRLKAWREDKEEGKIEIGRHDFTQMAFPMHYRQSSKAEDEPLCLGLLAGIPASFLLTIPPDCRMEQLFGQFKTVPSEIIFSTKERIHKPARKWIPTSLLNSSNFFGGPDGQPTPDGLLVRFGGMLLGPLGDNKLFPCRDTSPDGFFYLKYGETTFLCRQKVIHYCIIPEDQREALFGHEPEYGVHLHSDANYQHWRVEDSALIFNCQDVLEEWTGEISAALVWIRRSPEQEAIDANFGITLKITRIHEEPDLQQNNRPGLCILKILNSQLWCVG
jgi:hypothetical protein